MMRRGPAPMEMLELGSLAVIGSNERMRAHPKPMRNLPPINIPWFTLGTAIWELAVRFSASIGVLTLDNDSDDENDHTEGNADATSEVVRDVGRYKR
jgi:hypothetical protein